MNFLNFEKILFKKYEKVSLVYFYVNANPCYCTDR